MYSSVTQLHRQQEGQASSPWWERAACRGRDIVLSFLGLLFLTPLFALIAAAIKRDSPGPVFYWGPRLGRDGELFKILKFRTMYERPESYEGPRITAGDDPRRTPVGAWLRATKLNERAQLWNVRTGEVSLVGPRPEDPEIAARWTRQEREEILSIRPGITSPATVLYRDEEDLLSRDEVMDDYLETIMPHKMRLDQIYVRNRSFWMDLDVLFWTMLVLIPRIGSVQPPEKLIFWGPIAQAFGRYLNWFSVDAIVSFLAFVFASLFLRLFGPLDVGWAPLLILSMGFALLFSMVGAVMGVQRIYWSKACGEDVVSLGPPVVVAGIIALGFCTLTGVLPLRLVLLASALAGLGFVVVRYRSRLLVGVASRLLARWETPTIARERLLIVGGGDAGQIVAWMIGNQLGDCNFHVVGFVDDDLYKQGARIRGVDVIGRREDIPELVKEHDIGIIVYAIHNIAAAERDEIMALCRQASIPVVEMPDFLGRLRTVASILADIQSVKRNIRPQEQQGD